MNSAELAGIVRNIPAAPAGFVAKVSDQILTIAGCLDRAAILDAAEVVTAQVFASDRSAADKVMTAKAVTQVLDSLEAVAA